MMDLPTALLFVFILLSTLEVVKLQDPECPEDGYFPSMTSCRQYNICFNGLKRTYICKNGIYSVYSPITRSCVKQRLGSKCYKFLCIGHKLHYVAYRGDPSIYVLCNQYRPQLLQKCPIGREFNNKAQKCVLTCGGSEGNKLDPEDCTGFYECVKAPGINNYNINRRACPKNAWFNPDLSQCTETGIENCPKVAPTTPQPPTISTTEEQPTLTPIFTTRSSTSTPSSITSTTDEITSTLTPLTTHGKPTTPTTAFTSITPVMSTTPPLTTYTNPITPITTVTAPMTSTTPVFPTTPPFTVHTDSTSTITAPITSTTPIITPSPPFTTLTNPTTPTATVTPATITTSTTENPHILTTTGIPTFPWGH